MNIPDDSTGFLRIFGAEPGSEAMLHDEAGNQTGYISKVWWIDERENDNALDLYLLIERSSSAGSSGIFTFQGVWIQGMDEEYSRILEGPWSIDLSSAAEAEHQELAVDGTAFRRLYNGDVYEWEENESMILRSMCLSPLALEFSYDYTSNDPRQIPGPGTIQLVMHDGEIINVSQLAGSSWDESHSSWQFLFDYPLVLNEIEYIQFGDLQIPVN